MTKRFGRRAYKITDKALSQKDFEKYDGVTYFDQRIIFIKPGLQGTVLLETIIHECAHAAFPEISEKRVERMARATQEVLRHFGFSQCE